MDPFVEIKNETPESDDDDTNQSASSPYHSVEINDAGEDMDFKENIKLGIEELYWEEEDNAIVEPCEEVNEHEY